MTRATLQDGRPRSQFYEIVHEVAAQFEPEVAAAFLAAVERLRSELDEDEIARALRAASPERLENAVKVGRFSGVMRDEIGQTLYRAQSAAGTIGGQLLSDVAMVEYEFNATDPNAIITAQTQAAELAVDLSAGQREAIREIVANAQARGLTVDEQARLIKELVGMRSKDIAAPFNLAQEIRDGNISAIERRARLPAAVKRELVNAIKADQVTDDLVLWAMGQYRDGLLQWRAEDIARTETLRAANQGQRLNWRQARDQGVLPPNVRRVWIVTPDDRLRPSHLEVARINAGGVLLDEEYETPTGPIDGPPYGVNCRCAEGLVFGRRVI